MKKETTTAFLVLFFIAALASTSNSPVGTWGYLAPTAPYEYSSGKFIVEKEAESYLITIQVNGQEIVANDVQYSEDKLSFTTYIESERVSFSFNVGENTMKGTASYSEGDVDITASKE